MTLQAIDARDPACLPTHYLIASDFDQTLSFNDSGAVLSEILGASELSREGSRPGREQSGPAGWGAGLPDPPRSRVPRRPSRAPGGNRPAGSPAQPHSGAGRSAGARHRAASLLVLRHLRRASGGHSVGTRRRGAARSDLRDRAGLRRRRPARCARSGGCPAGYGKVAVLEEIESRLGIVPDRTIYVGDGSSDVHVMLHVNNRDGFTIAVSENRLLARIARSTVLSDNAFSIMAPVLERSSTGTPARSARCSRPTAWRCRRGKRPGPTASRCATRVMPATPSPEGRMR